MKAVRKDRHNFHFQSGEGLSDVNHSSDFRVLFCVADVERENSRERERERKKIKRERERERDSERERENWSV